LAVKVEIVVLFATWVCMEAVFDELVLRDLPDTVRSGLQRRAAQHGRSLEAEVREVLQQAVAEVAGVTVNTTEPDDAWIKRVEMYLVETEAWEAFDQSLVQSRSAWRDQPLDLDQ
jgi:plasmid stability protein